MIEEVIKEIGENEITFERFMEIALYHPKFGYYSKGGKIGKKGDYFTSPHVGPAFGELIALQIEEMWRILGMENFKIVEMGAGKGYLCKDILEYVKDNFPEFYKKLEYIVLERSLEMIKKQRNIVDKNKVKWMKDCPQIKGCFVSNEFFDSMPVHVVEMQEKLKEVYVAYKRKFFEVLKKPSRKELEEYLEKTGINLKKGRRIEVNLQSVEWVNKIARCLHKGFVITIDYGYLSSEVESWPRGTLLCYFKHRVNEEPFKRIGMQDITSHVNFSALMKYGKEHGLEITGYTDQTHFLMALLENYVERLNSNYLDRMLQIKNLILPEGMGGVFKVLIQHKGIENPVLSGLKYEKGFAVS